MISREAREQGEILRCQAVADAKTLGPGSIQRANQKRIGWNSKVGGKRFPSSIVSPTVNDLGAFVCGLGLDVPAWCERTARYASGPVADFMAMAESVKDHRPASRLPKALSLARGRTWHPPVDLGSGVLEELETMRFDDPKGALTASRAALKTASGPSSVGRVLAVHASNLREAENLAGALLSLSVTLPALDVAGDAWGMGRALTTAATVARALGRINLARSLIDHAEAWYLRDGSAEGRGTTLAFRGVLALTDSKPRTALRELDAALALFPPARRLWIAGVHQVKAVALLKCSDVTGSRAAISQALAIAPDARAFRGYIAWQAGNIETETGDHETAEALYQQAFGLISEPLCDRLLIAAQAVRAVTRQGESTRAVALARSLLGPMLERFDDTDPTRQLLRAAHLEIYRAALEASLPVTILNQAISRIEVARTARLHRAQRQVINPR